MLRLEVLHEFLRLEGKGRLGVHVRRAKGRRYESPRIFLPRKFLAYAGRPYVLLSGRAWFTHVHTRVGEIVVLFFEKGKGGE